MKASVKEPNMFHNYETEKITRKSTAEYIKLFGSSAWDRHADVFSVISERPPIYASCMTISGGRTEQHVIIAGFLPRHW